MEPSNYIGRAPEQVLEFLEEYVNPVLAKYKGEKEYKDQGLNV